MSIVVSRTATITDKVEDNNIFVYNDETGKKMKMDKEVWDKLVVWLGENKLDNDFIALFD